MGGLKEPISLKTNEILHRSTPSLLHVYDL